jgi:hypothetical protein
MDKLTFWDLLKDNYKKDGEFVEHVKYIEIPVIQRGYAQGRISAEGIRNNFLNAIQDALNNKGMVMDFVYGTINDSNKFEPLDGQQRLTTLFLLHWYLASKERKEDAKEVLGNFSYQTRNSSERFCKQLANFFWTQEEYGELKKGEKLRAIIENQEWFATAWKHDSTVEAMLVMLEALHERFKNTGKLDDLIGERRAIVFNFVNLKSFDLTDDLYIKMNARGKPLTPFEIFKSALDKKLLELQANNTMSKDEVKEYTQLIDGHWMDLFFKMVPDSEENFDTRFLVFFIRIMEYAILEKVSDKKVAEVYNNLQKKGLR